MKYDFSGYASKNNLRCSDGRVIRRNAFKDNDGSVVPLVWQHRHDDPMNVLGHAQLENREDGVYAYCSLNDTEPANHAKTLIEHGDITSMSIFANNLVQKGSDVFHGVIREVSLVLAGANPGASIENWSFAHGDGTYEMIEDEAVIYPDVPINILQHADDEEAENNQNGSSSDKTIQDVIDSMTEEQKNVLYFLVDQAAEGSDDSDDEMEHSALQHADEDDSDGEGKTVQQVVDSMTEEQKNVMYYLIGQAAEGSDGDEDIEVDEIDERTEVMKHNIFDGTETEENTISHDAMMAALEDCTRYNKMSEAFIAHGIDDIEILYPEAKSVTTTPEMITRRMDWVSDVWNALKKTPFSRIKSVAADLTEDDARAKGYIKGNEKTEEQFGLLKRVTTPQTVYKKQSLDRDDIIDITDFDVVAWLKQEMRMMLDEELSRAVLVGDGRLVTSPDKIKEDNIRPIYQDADMYTIHWSVNAPASMDDNEKSNYLVDQALRSRKDYKGSGTPVFYATVDVINDMLLARDKVGRRMYNTEAELASALRVSRIVEVPIMEGVTRTDSDGKKHELIGLIVNLADYSLGTDRGGAVSFFDDFDIDFNKEKYLIETRCSGALTHPYSAIALEKDSSTSTPSTPSTPSTEALG